MAGDIIFEDGTIITPADLEKLIPLITNALGATAKDPSEYPVLERLDDLTSLPVFDAAYNLGRVSILRLKGVNGKNAILRVQGDMLQWSLEGTDIWNDLYSKSDLKGDPGAAANMEIGEVASGDTPAATITGEAPNYKLNLVLVPGGKGDTGDDGKTPVLASVNAQSGETASGSFTDDGVDESGNPKYILDLTLPKGQDGQPAIFEQGTTTTLNPSEEARVEVIENGLTPEGNPKYLLNFFIPRGPAGPAGTGTGNVLVDATGLVSGKKYLFVPDSDGSTAGTFVEYTPTGNASADASGLMSADQFQKLEKLNPDDYVKKDGSTPFTNHFDVKASDSYVRFVNPTDDTEKGSVGGDDESVYLFNWSRRNFLKYTNAGKLLFEDKETFAVDADNELTLAGKKLSELGGGSQYLDLTPLIDNSGNLLETAPESFMPELQKAIENKVSTFYVPGAAFPGAIINSSETECSISICVIGSMDGIGQYLSQTFIIDKVARSIRFFDAGGPLGHNFLDLSPMFGSDGNPVENISEDFFNKIRLAQTNGITSFLIPEFNTRSACAGIIRNTNPSTETYAISITIPTGINDISDLMIVYFDFVVTKHASSDIRVETRMSQSNIVVSGDGTKFKTDNGTYKVIPLATESANGLLSAALFKKLNRLYTTATSISSLDVTYKVIYVSLTANGSLSASATDSSYNGHSITVYVYCSAARTITIPTTGNYVSMCGSSYTCPVGKWVEFNLTCVNGIWHIAKLEQE